MNKTLYSTLVLAAAGTLGVPAAAQEAKPGDAGAGATKIAMCIGCHNIPRYQTSFPEVYKVPKIAGQNEKYIVAALTEYRKGDRKHPTMRAIAASLSDQDIADVAAFYSKLGLEGAAAAAAPAGSAASPAEQPPAQVAKLLAPANCASCHGANFNAPIDPSYPKLAGQYADYLYAALKAYQTDKNPHVGRNNAIMTGMAKPFSHADLKLIANYLADLPGDVKTVPEASFRAGSQF
jgi:cytochrome c553